MNSKQLLEQLLQLTVWLDIKGYENYQISICGSVRNSKTKRILQPGNNSYGYYFVNLYKNGKNKIHKIHRLVANAFIPRVDITKTYVDHIDNDRINNTISNLRWCTFQQNQFNRQINNNSISKIKGVSFYKRNNKWRARIRFNNKLIHLGYFDNLEDAKQARQKKSIELFGIYQNSCEK